MTLKNFEFIYTPGLATCVVWWAGTPNAVEGEKVWDRIHTLHDTVRLV